MDTDEDTRLNMVENNIHHTVDVTETTTPHPNTAVGTDKDTRFNMVEVMGIPNAASIYQAPTYGCYLTLNYES